MSPASLTFPTVADGVQSATQDVTFTNSTGANLTMGTIGASGVFGVSSTTCPSSGQTLSTGANCTISVYFNPTTGQTGNQTGTLTIGYGASQSKTVSLSGTAQTASITVSPASWNAGNVTQGQTSSLSLTFTNYTSNTVVITAPSGLAPWTFSQPSCSASAWSTCSITANLAPSISDTAGATSASAGFTNNFDSTTTSVSLSGTVVGTVGSNTSSLAYGTVTSGTTSPTQTITLTNGTGSSVSLGTVSSSNSAFTIVSNGCTNGTSLASGSSCSVTVAYSPASGASGAASGTVTLNYGSGQSKTVSVSGTASPMVSLSIAQSPLFLNMGVSPNILVIYDNSQSMDGLMNGALVAGDNTQTRGNVGRSVIRSTMQNYWSVFNWGLMSFSTSSVSKTNTWVYFIGDSTSMVFTDDCVAIAPYSSVSAMTPGYSATNSRNCIPNPNASTSVSGDSFVTYDKSSDDPSIMDVLYSSSWSGTWGLSAGTGGSYNFYSTHGANLNWTSGSFSGSQGSVSFTPTDAGFTAKNPPYTRMVFLPRAWGYKGNISGSGTINEVVKPCTNCGTPSSDSHYNTLMGFLANETSSSTSSEIKNAATFTPTLGSVQSAFKYFSGTMTGKTSPVLYSCQKNYTILVTDGMPTADATGNQYPYPYDLSVSGTQVSPVVDAIKCLANNGSSCSGGNSTTGVKVSGLSNSTSSNGNFPVLTYVLGLGDTISTDPSDLNSQGAAALNAMASAGGTTSAYFANSASGIAGLQSSFQSIVSDIVARESSASAVSLNRGTWSTGSMLYQARFNSGDWSGSLLGYSVNADSSISATATFDAAGQIPAATSRVILTRKDSVALGTSGMGIPFRWDSLSTTEQTALNTNATGTNDSYGSLRLTYLRGDRTNESATSTPMFHSRTSSVTGSPLGDIVNSSPYWVGSPAFAYPDTGLGNAAQLYSAYYASKKDRTPMVYVGANDGMLHGFDASTGVEKLAYVPSYLFRNQKLSKLTDPTYSHRFYVDASPTAGDAFMPSGTAGASVADGKWHTMLVSGMGAGGQGIFALDVTDPSSFSETNASSLVMWEFNDSDDADLGYTYSQPLIVKLNNGKWGVIIGNGYNAMDSDGYATTTGYASLFILDAQTGQKLAKLDTKTSALVGTTSKPNGLSSPTAIDINSDGLVDYVYSGDLNGNIWKFDITSSSASNWKVAYGTTNAPVPFVKNNRNTAGSQPVTTSIEAMKATGAQGGYMLLFGTGKYMETSDQTNTDAQSFYGFWDPMDNTTTYTISSGTGLGANLLKQSVTGTTTVSSPPATYRVTTQAYTGTNSVFLGSGTGKYSGWYLDLPTSAERQITDPVISHGKVIFTTMIPSTAACSWGGSGWVMELDAQTGNRMSAPTFDVTGDGLVNYSDKVTNTGAVTGDGATTVFPSGMQVNAIPSSPGILGGNMDTQNGLETKFTSLSNGNISRILERSGSSQVGRVSWRQIK